MLTRTVIDTRSFKNEDQGSVTIMFSLVAVILLMFSGLAIDYGRITNVSTNLGGAADATSLAAGKALLEGKLNDTEIVEMAEKFFVVNTKATQGIGKTSKPDISINRESGKVSVKAESVVQLTVGRVSGKESMTVPVVSEAVYQQKDIEVGMALDITGSMRENDSAGKPKIAGLKQAFEAFADKLMPDNSLATNSVKIGVAPYSFTVNLGSYSDAATNKKSVDGCVTERKNGAQNDSVSDFFVEADGNKDVDPTEGYGDPSRKGYAYGCPSAQLTPLSDDKASLVSKVKSFQPDGWTSGHLGVQWAWNLVSDQWSFGGSKAEGYQKVQDQKLVKAVVIMTDGNFNTAFHGKKSSEQAIELCNSMKAKGVTVFAVAFAAPAPAQATLKACATQGSGYYANAASASELEAAFEKFAGQLSQLRVSR